MKYTLAFCISFFVLSSCKDNKAVDNAFRRLDENVPSIEGKKEYLDSPFVTAGNRVYMVGHQDGSFPELGWHIKGEMGGIWNHPIKLMDGFEVSLDFEDIQHTLAAAQSFVNYPFANKQVYNIPEKELGITRWQFVPDDMEGIAVVFEIANLGDATQQFDFDFTGHSDLRPTWLSERTSMEDATDVAHYKEVINGWLVKDKNNPWYVCYNATLPPKQHATATNTYEGKGVSNKLSYGISLGPKTTTSLQFNIAGSFNNEAEALNTLQKLQTDLSQLLFKKKQRYEQLATQTKLTIPDKKMQQAFEWLKYNCDWLVRKVPGIGTGITAGIPDYPWWFGVDSEYALQGYMAIGQEKAVYQTIALLDSVSNAVNGNGKIIHEMSTNGAVFNPGNINETPQFATLIWRIYRWNGDVAFLERYFPTIEKGLAWLMNNNDANGNGFPEGFGMMEVHGLDSEMIDVAVYSQKAFHDASQMAKILGKEALADSYASVARSLKENINSEFWSPDFNSYADFIGTDAQALHLIEDAIIRADTLGKPWSIKEMELTREFILNNPSTASRPFVLHHNWVVNTPMEMGIADSIKAFKALETAENYVNPFGVFVTGIDRDESAGSNENTYKAPPIFTYTGAVMTLPTGVSAIAENNYGRPNEALDYLERMTRSFSYALPGSMYEVSPDFGMMAQAWNIYSYAYPIVHQFFGVTPNTANKEVLINPKMPDAWDNASLENIKVGDNEVSIYYSKTNDGISIKVVQSNPDWTITINPNSANTISKKGKEVSLNL